MKSKILLLIILCSGVFASAQQAINYKALIKDNAGDVLSSQTVILQFTIRRVDDGSIAYQENHTTATDTNGIVIVDIGSGNILNGNYSTMDWGSSEHVLNVQIDSGSGLVDLGTTQFNAVPYALYAENSGSSSTGLEAIDEGNGQGWRLIGVNLNNYSNIGSKGVDLSYSSISNQVNGASGSYSIAAGFNTRASGFVTTAMGQGTLASGDNSIAMGWLTNATGSNATAMGYRGIASGDSSFAFGQDSEASGFRSTAGGYSTIASGEHAVALGFTTQAIASNATALGFYTIADDADALVIGRYNDPTPTNTLFQIGNGTADIFLSNAFTVIDTGDAFLSGSLSQNSDRRLKQDIDSLKYGLNEILKMTPVSYHWKKNPAQSKSLGLIAQEIQSIVNEIVHVSADKDKTLSVSYIELIPVIIKAIQEQQVIIENQKLTISKQEQTNINQSAILQKLVERVDTLERQSKNTSKL